MSLLDERSTQNVKFQLLNFAVIYFVAGLFSSQCYALKSTKFRCKRVDTCVCMFENEEGYNLSALSANENGLNATIGNLTFYFHPCTDISIGNKTDLNDCYKGTSVCLYNSTDQTYTNLGLSHEVRVTSNGLLNPVAFVYSHNNSEVSTTVKMSACADESSLKVGTSNIVHNYELLLSSPSACRQRVYVQTDPPVQPQGHLSTGSVLVIMFIVFSSLYFVGGALVLKLLRGAEGREMIPNYDFWVSLPGLVKEGFLFTLSGCRSAQAYDRI